MLTSAREGSRTFFGRASVSWMEGLQKDLDDCRTCTDIKDWQRKARKLALNLPALATPVTFAGNDTIKETKTPECPPDAGELGRSTWTFLHVMSTYYPVNPTLRQQYDMRQFIRILGNVYPCSACASSFREECKENPPRVESRQSLMRWFCEQHNEVRRRQGKEVFECNTIMERWRTGPPNGECDMVDEGE